MLFIDSHPLPPPTWEGVLLYQSLDCRLTAGGSLLRRRTLQNVNFAADAKHINFVVSMLFFFHTPCPLSLGEREGVPPHTRPFTFVNGATTPLEGSGTGRGGHFSMF